MRLTPPTMTEKVAHVRAATDDEGGKHHCHWTGCTKSVPAAKWGCKTHWFKLPYFIRNAIWIAYRPGQESTKSPSREYVEAARRAQDWIRANHPPKPSQPVQEKLL